MTKAELEKEAEKHADGIYHYKINVSDYGEEGKINYRYSDVKEAYIKGAEPREKRIAELEAQIEKMKSQYDYAFNQLCKSREILCSMLSQYRDRKEIDYSTRECGEKLLKEEVYKNGR